MAEERSAVGTSGIEYKRPFAAIRKDPEWKRKIGQGMGVMLIPYLGAVWWMGWQMQYERAVAWGRDESLPEWSDFKGQAMLGLWGFIAVLPCSLLMSLAAIPFAFTSMFSVSAVADQNLAATMTAMVGGYVLMFATVLVLSALLIPLTSAVTLRVALYGTLESGFQLGEIWRLMREHRRGLMRAWGFAALNMAITALSFLLYFVVLGVILASFLAVGQESGIVPAALVGTVGYLAYIAFALALGLVLGLANAHYFARWGRVAYGLGAS